MIISDIMGMKRIDDLPDIAECVKGWWQASEDISVGKAVMIDFGVQTGKKVLVATTANDQLTVGIFEGEGLALRGAETTISGLKGRNAIAGDYILVTTAGPATARFDMATVAIPGAALTLTTATSTIIGGNGVFATGANPTLAIQQPIVVLGTATTGSVVSASATASATMKVWVRYFP